MPSATLKILLAPLFYCGLFGLTACENKNALLKDCASTADMEAICRFHNPEDMELLPDRQTLLVSQMGNMEGSLPGNLVAFDTTTQAITLLFSPSSLNTPTELPTENWGASCPGMPGAEFSPHGISLTQRRDGRWQLAVINHGQRESVEMFELQGNSGQWTLAWRGCVVPTDGIYMNDVALMHDGGFVASHMFDKHSPVVFGMPMGIWQSQLGMDTGYVFEWLPSAPGTFRVLEESHGPFINGILINDDNKTVFASVYAKNEIRRLDRLSGKKTGEAEIAQVDNMAWDPHKNILATSHTGKKLDQLACKKNPGQTCGFGYTVVRLNPETMASEKLFVHEGGAPMGAATVALQAGKHLYLGSFSGDRIIRKVYTE
jgi:hypothetical protein